MRIKKMVAVPLTLACIALACSALAIPTLLAYLWLHPVGFWQRLAFALALIVVALFPFRTKTNKTNSNPDATRNLEKVRQVMNGEYTLRPASLRHREMTQAMRDTATGYGLLPKRNFNNGTVN